jgi:hypothetical protein
MKPSRMRQLLILSAVYMTMLQPAIAQDNAEITSGYVQVETSENPASGMSPVIFVNPVLENNDLELLNELLQPDPATMTELTALDELCAGTVCQSETPR